MGVLQAILSKYNQIDFVFVSKLVILMAVILNYKISCIGNINSLKVPNLQVYPKILSFSPALFSTIIKIVNTLLLFYHGYEFFAQQRIDIEYPL